MPSTIEPSNQPTDPAPLWIVGIGASAGGVPAIDPFFASLPDHLGAAFVVVQHLSPDFRSSLPGLIQRQTQMPVYSITDGMTIAANAVYVLSPGYTLKLKGRQLRQEPITEVVRINSIDRFFQSLAETAGDDLQPTVGHRIIGILLSGTGHDGTEGLQAISRAGGIALVQSAETAQFTSMVTSAIPSGLVDEILSPQELAEAVCGLIQFGADGICSGNEAQGLIDPGQLQRILAILLEKEQIDFSQYKPGTLSRRILHRQALIQSANLEEYIHRLEESSEEQRLLRQDLLIGATRFFRDPPAWEAIARQILPQLIDRLQPLQPLRMWMPACATGEEAYTMAILVHEAIAHTGRTIPVKIFATDLDTQALQVASKGIYPETIAEHVSPERLERYFFHQAGQFQVKRCLREMLIFAPHDLTRNAGFSGMHLVSCRNVLIYLQPELQQRVLRLLHFALVPQGILFLGSSETLGELASEFLTLDPLWRLYRKRRDVVLLGNPFTREPISTPIAPVGQPRSGQRQVDRWVNHAFQFCFANRPITCLLINRDNQLLHVFYNAANLLAFPVGEACLEVTQMVVPELRLPLSTALHRAKREQQSVLYTGVKLERFDPEASGNPRQETVTMHIGFGAPSGHIGFGVPSGHSGFGAPSGGTLPLSDGDCLIVVLEIEAAAPVLVPESQTFKMDNAAVQQIAELEYELQQTRENLQVTIEELETTNEEQQATNEELLAANEELQSTNEELQSVNEELYTINSEYQNKIQELTQLSGDVDNLLRSTEIGVVFLDVQLNLRKFTPAATQMINLRPVDEGRPLAHFTHNLDCPDLISLLQGAIASGQILEQEVTLISSGDHFLMRVHPYLRDDGTQDGGVVTFINVNELKHTQQALLESRNFIEQITTSSPGIISIFDLEHESITYMNRAIGDLLGFSPAEVEEMGANSLFTLMHPDDRTSVQQFMQNQLRTAADGQVLTLEYRARHRDGHYRWFHSRNTVFSRTETGQPQQVLAISTDISDRKQLETVLLTEMHHRVKNNLQVLASLLSLQSRKIADPVAVEALREAKNRIYAIAQVHEQIYQSPDLTQIDLQPYLLELTNHLFDAYGVSREHIRLTLDASSVALHLPRAIPLALILNELVTNALKYAFVEQQLGELLIRIQCHPTPGTPAQVILTVQDNGVGLPPTVDWQHPTSTGLEIVQCLVKQLEGTIALEQQAGTTFTVTFPLETPGN